MDKPWLESYPSDVRADVDVTRHRSVADLLDESTAMYADRVAYRFMGRSYSYAEIDRRSRYFAAYLQGLGLKEGARVGVMLPNVPQYPVVAAAVLRAGMVLVNINPLYTARELEHQLQDSGTELIVIIENFAHVLESLGGKTACRHVVLTSVGDMLGRGRGGLTDFVLRRVRRSIPSFTLPGAVRFSSALSAGRRRTLQTPVIGPEDVAVLQYTGGTTGVSKGATLLHKNLVANILQCRSWFGSALKLIDGSEQVGMVCALPLYHIYAFTGIMMQSMAAGGRVILVPNPRDAAGTLKLLSKERFHIFPGVNTLFNTYARHPDFRLVDWGRLRLTLSAGMATQKATAELWLRETGSPICEAFGLSEASPLVTCNPVGATAFNGSIGLPVPGTEVALFNECGQRSPPGEPGELAVRGPQVMAGYWNRPEETAKTIRPDGFLLTGDVAVMDERGYFRIVDRKKDMVLVSGFNVYPNEVEDVIAQVPGVIECAAVGVPDDRSGEALKVFIVRADVSVSEALIRAHCERMLTAYKRPRHIEFVSDLPKSNVGKVLRRELRSRGAASAQA